MYPSVPAFPSNYRQDIDQEATTTASFYGEIQPLGTIHDSELSMDVLGDMPLHGAAIGNDAHLAGAMLHDSVDPSSAMPFAHMGDHALRVEDNELGELDSLMVWPSKRARRM